MSCMMYNNHTVNKIYVLCLVCLVIVQQSYSQQDVCPCVLYAWSLYNNRTVNKMYVLVSCMPDHCTTIIQSIRSMFLCRADLIQKLRYRERERQRLQRQKSRDRDTRRTLSYDTPPFYMSSSEGASDSGANAAGPAGSSTTAGASDGNTSTADPLSAQRRQLGERLYPKVQMLQPVSGSLLVAI